MYGIVQCNHEEGEVPGVKTLVGREGWSVMTPRTPMDGDNDGAHEVVTKRGYCPMSLPMFDGDIKACC